MATRIISNPARVHAFVNAAVPVSVTSGMKGLGLERDGELIAGVLYEGFNGANVWTHIAGVPGGHWMTPAFLRYIFSYPFNEMRVNRISCWVTSTNAVSRRFVKNLGFRQEAVLKGAAKGGADAIIYVMTREECRYV